jgi:type I restriction enzyme S subunit
VNLETFFERFDLFADAANAVQRMRELILFLAVQGKLTEQSDREDIESQIECLRRQAKRNGTSLHEFSGDVPFQVPGNWKWSLLGETMDMVNGRAFKPSEWTNTGTPIIRIQNLNKDSAAFNFYQGEVDKKVHVNPGDLLISWSGTPGTSFGAFIWDRGFAYLNQHIFRCELVEGVYDIAFLRLAINSRLDEMIAQAQGGVGLRHITKGKLEQIQLPLPPLAEQKRIVAKVDELMALCDALEAQQKEREAKRSALAKAALAAFAEAPSPTNLELLFHPSYAIDPADLRKSILTLAVQGKLVEQEGGDENGGEIPGWGSSRYGEITEFITSGSRGWKDFYSDSGSIFVRTQNINTDRLVLDDVAYVKLLAKTEGMRTQIHPGDILITITGANVTKAALVDQDLPEAYVSQHIALTRPIDSRMSPWLHLCFLSPGSARGQLERLAYGDKPGLNLTNIRDLDIPLPPLAEQKRIVAKVDELMKLVDRLEAQEKDAREKGAQLLEAMVAELAGRAAA